ncbi:hypothetical protein [Mycobacterium malmoense]|uniref:hypothetical protein n=1 Tax=Mycobacterium malmoense TaxID=1780 RepID=UPI0008F8D9ED|nr:hypothetical protein [Mycobacterium malmoense]OIN79352.1 hypothetical protein BMG05_18375 [Mycobacterium malmoense]
MFVVAPAARSVADPAKPAEFTVAWPVVFENPDTGLNSSVITRCGSREAAQQLADDLNTVLTKGA